MSTSYVRRKTYNRLQRARRFIQNYNQVPLSHYDVDEFGQIVDQDIKDAIQSFFTDGFYGTIGKVTGGGIPNTVNIDPGSATKDFITGNGILIKFLDQASLTLDAKPVVGTRNDLVYVEIWEQEIDINDLPSISDPVGEVKMGAPVPSVSKIVAKVEFKKVTGSLVTPTPPADDPTYLSSTPDDGTPRKYSDGSWNHQIFPVAHIVRDSTETNILNSQITDVRPWTQIFSAEEVTFDNSVALIPSTPVTVQEAIDNHITEFPSHPADQISFDNTSAGIPGSPVEVQAGLTNHASQVDGVVHSINSIAIKYAIALG